MVAACPFPCRRGTPIRIERLAEAVARSGRPVHVVAYHYAGDGNVSLGASDPVYQLHRIPRVPGSWDPAPGPGLGKMAILNPLLLAKTVKVVRQHGIRLLHCHHYEGLLVGLAVRQLLPVSIVYDAHTLLGDELSYYGPEFSKGALTRFGTYLDRTLPKRANHVIPVTDDIFDKIAEHGGNGERMTIIGNGIEEEAIEAFSQGDVAPVPGRVVYAGNLAAYQGIDLLLEAFKLAAAECQEAQLVLVSPKPHGPVQEAADNLGIGDRVSFVDAEHADLPFELRSASVLVNPRVHCPGYPLKLLNYMAAGRPIVSFDSSGKNLRNGVDAVLVPDEDIPGFAKGIAGLLSNPDRADDLGGTARQRAFRDYSWNAIAMRVHHAYEQALSDVRGAEVPAVS
nr:glycosyltransferase family 4 protein [Tropicimonas marinistellae]